MAKLIIQRNYGQCPNKILNCPTLSFKAKGLRTYLQSKPSGRDFSMGRMAKQTSEGIDSIRAGINELQKHGLVKRTPVKNQQGRRAGYNYILLESLHESDDLQNQPSLEKPSSDFPTTVSPTTVSPTSENHHTLSKKEDSNKEVVIKRENKSEGIGKNQKKLSKGKRLELFDEFRSIYPNNRGKAGARKYYLNKLRDTEHHELIMTTTTSYIAEQARLEQSGEFTPQHPYGSTFLNQDRYLDYEDTNQTIGTNYRNLRKQSTPSVTRTPKEQEEYERLKEYGRKSKLGLI